MSSKVEEFFSFRDTLLSIYTYHIIIYQIYRRSFHLSLDLQSIQYGLQEALMIVGWGFLWVMAKEKLEHKISWQQTG